MKATGSPQEVTLILAREEHRQSCAPVASPALMLSMQAQEQPWGQDGTEQASSDTGQRIQGG